MKPKLSKEQLERDFVRVSIFNREHVAVTRPDGEVHVYRRRACSGEGDAEAFEKTRRALENINRVARCRS